MQAINATNADLTVWWGIYLAADDTIDTVYERQWGFIEDALKTYGTDHFGGITVGASLVSSHPAPLETRL